MLMRGRSGRGRLQDFSGAPDYSPRLGKETGLPFCRNCTLHFGEVNVNPSLVARHDLSSLWICRFSFVLYKTFSMAGGAQAFSVVDGAPTTALNGHVNGHASSSQAYRPGDFAIDEDRRFKVVVIGCGFSGICAGIRWARTGYVLMIVPS